MRPPLPCLPAPVARACGLLAAALLVAARAGRAEDAAEPFRFRDVGDEAGVFPHVGGVRGHGVAFGDVDGNGWPDLFVSVVKFKDGQPHPVIFRNLGAGENGVPRFQADAWAVNDFPTEADRGIKRSGDFFDKMLREQKIIYMAAAPSVDFDRDGRLDFFLANWWLESRSLLLRNETKGGRWLSVRVHGGPGVNRQGVGARVKLYAAGKAGQPDARLASREIAIGFGYCSGQEAEAHFGLGTLDQVDVVVEWPAGKGTLTRANVLADQRLLVTP